MITQPNALHEHLAFELEKWTENGMTQSRIDATTVITQLETGNELAQVMDHAIVPWVANNFMVSWRQASFALSGSGALPFGVKNVEFKANSDLIKVIFTTAPDSIDVSGWSVTIEGGAGSLSFSSINGLEAFFLTDQMPVGSTVVLTYDGAGNTLQDGEQLAADSWTAVQIKGDLAFAALGSLHLFSDGAVDDHRLQAMAVGVGNLPNSTPELFLPDHAGVFRTHKAGFIPWQGARVDDTDPQNFLFYDDVSPGGAVIDPYPKVYVAPSLLNRNPRSHKLLNWTSQGVGGVNQNVAIGLDGTISASRVTDTDPSGYYACYYEIPVNATAQVTSQWAIAKQASQTAWIGLGNGNFGGFPATYGAFNQVTGVFNQLAGTFTEIIVDGSHPDFWFITLEQANTGTIYQQKVWAAISLDGLTLAANAQGYCDVAYASLTDESTAEQVRGAAPIMTNGSSQSVDACHLDYSILNHGNEEGAYYLEMTALQDAGGFANSVGLLSLRTVASSVFNRTTNAGGEVRTYNSVSQNSSTGVLNWVAGQVVKLGSAYSIADDSLVINADGSYGSTIAYAGRAINAGITVGLNADQPMLIGNVRRYDMPYADAITKVDELMA